MQQDFGFDTLRLKVRHAEELARENRADLLKTVTRLLTKEAVVGLPTDWHGIDSYDKADLWLSEQMIESTLLVVSDNSTGTELGFVLLHQSDPAYQTWHLGYLIGEAYWGRGYATELVVGLVTHLKHVVNAPMKLLAGVEAENIPSIKILEKGGFTRLAKPNPHGTLFYELGL